MKVLVTGATGFIGSHVCRDLLARGVQVRALMRRGSSLARRAEPSDIEWAHGDLLEVSDSALASLAAGVDACIHTAWHVVPGEYLLSPKNDEHKRSSLRLFTVLASEGCRQITGVGTCFEYRQAAIPLHESAPLEPRTPYAAAKAATFTEASALFRASPTAFAWARVFYLYGPGEDSRRLVPDVTLKLLRGERAAVTRGTQVRDFLHVEDVASALVAITLGGLRGAVNVGSSEPIQVAEIVRAIGEIIGRPDLLDVGARAENTVDPPYVCADNTRLREETEWRRRYGLPEGLRETVAWWRNLSPRT
jgi:nucleoside-diphosphate-sugar epimerase